MATVRIKNITTTATSPSGDDFVAIDGATNGTRKIDARPLGGVFDEDITTTQQIGAGTATPSSTASRYLTVGDASGQSDILINSANANFGQLIFGDADAEFRGSISYSHSADEFQIYTAGSSRATIDSTGSLTVSGGVINIGAADTASGHINAFENLTFSVDTDNDDSGTRYFAWYTNGSSGSGTELMRLLETGDLAVGLSSADAKLHVAGDVKIENADNCNLILRSDSDNNSGSRNTQIQFQIDSGTVKGLVSYDQDADVMQLSYGGNNKHLVVDSSGRTGIGTASPGFPLTVAKTGDGTKVDITNTVDTNFRVSINSGAAQIGPSTSSSLELQTGGTTRATITTGGNLAINRSAAGAKIDIATAADSNGFFLRDVSDQSITHSYYIDASGNSQTTLYADGQVAKIQLNTAGDSYFNGGSVGIGQSSPGSYYSGANNLVVGSNSGSEGITIASGTGNSGSLYFADGTAGNQAYRGYVEYDHTNDKMLFGTAGSTRWAINSSGNFVSQGGGIDFGTSSTGAGTASGGLLSDYEEGTATISDSSGAGLTYTGAACNYIKIGSQVTAWVTVTYPTTSDSSNSAVGGFPFAFGANDVDRIGGSVSHSSVSSAITVLADNGTSHVRFRKIGGGTYSNAELSGQSVWFSMTYDVS